MVLCDLNCTPQVCRGGTGHAEAVQVLYDPAHVDYCDLVRVAPGSRSLMPAFGLPAVVADSRTFIHVACHRLPSSTRPITLLATEARARSIVALFFIMTINRRLSQRCELNDPAQLCYSYALKVRAGEQPDVACRSRQRSLRSCAIRAPIFLQSLCLPQRSGPPRSIIRSISSRMGVAVTDLGPTIEFCLYSFQTVVWKRECETGRQGLEIYWSA